jgi:hypothetical protein
MYSLAPLEIPYNVHIGSVKKIQRELRVLRKVMDN